MFSSERELIIIFENKRLFTNQHGYSGQSDCLIKIMRFSLHKRCLIGGDCSLFVEVVDFYFGEVFNFLHAKACLVSFVLKSIIFRKQYWTQSYVWYLMDSKAFIVMFQFKSFHSLKYATLDANFICGQHILCKFKAKVFSSEREQIIIFENKILFTNQHGNSGYLDCVIEIM